MSNNKPVLLAIYTLTLGAIMGTLVGEILGFILPEGVVKQFFLLSKTLSVGPGTLNIIMLQLTLGLSITLNVISLIGIGVAYYLLRWWR
ncbi:MAG: DUF4321 domain-containing protein [Candidatus Marinimicrobia bacterium]|nr:DUF4321 domain-containing protein [Candidatus Neomarinimicrobiota bacterium]MCH8305873.1 DUF4321 domain-containing protein [Candidatus Neomarinimicrobiota bacterium]TFB11113.1 DUF4321 domain-containing protein [Candidatus Marinimicrobia bacterium MT.SAG.2]